MKYKIGDKVKIKDKIECYYGISDEDINKFKNQILNIKSCNESGLGNWYKIVEDTGKFNWNKNMLELVEEKNKFKIGQRVKIKRTGKNAKIHDITDNDYLDNGASFRCYKVYYEKENNIDWGMFSVHDLEEVEEILEEKEKEYLRAVIKPFKKYVEYIKKVSYEDCDKEFIRIVIKKENEENINLPFFEKGEMYKGMEIKKEYTLEELGL